MSIPVENQEVVQTEVKTNDKEYNFAQLRKQAEKEREARMQAEQRIRELEEEKTRLSKPTHVDELDDDNEPYVDKRSLKRHLSEFSKNIGQEIDKKAEEKARAIVEQERQLNFIRNNPDFNAVLTPEMVQKFAEKHPDIAEPMLEMPDNFARQKLLYQNIKALGINRREEPAKTIQQTIDANRKGVYYSPSSAPGSPPYAMNGDFSPKGQENAYAKMKELIQNRRG